MREGRIYTKDNTGQVRVYDGAAITPDEKYIGLEVKSGKAQKTKAQREFDNRISKSNPAIGVGQSEGITITHSITIGDSLMDKDVKNTILNMGRITIR